MLKVDICEEEITISTEDGLEVVHWTCDEWNEDPSIVPAIANAIYLAHIAPGKLMKINMEHVKSQMRINNE